MVDFPTLTRKIDVRNLSQTVVDPTMRSSTEGGLIITRPRYTRRPRKIFTVGLVDMPDADKLILEQFQDDVKVGSVAFNWTHPVSSVVYVVRLSAPISFTLSGPGTSHRWDATGIKLEEV